jgi:hypothetical protein
MAGARASANLYGLIETAKANRIEPSRYLAHLFEILPSITELGKRSDSDVVPFVFALIYSPSLH